MSEARMELETQKTEQVTKPEQLINSTSTNLLAAAGRLVELGGVPTTGVEGERRGIRNKVGQKFLTLFGLPDNIDINGLIKSGQGDGKITSIAQTTRANFENFLDKISSQLKIKREELVNNPGKLFRAMGLDRKTALISRAAILAAPFILREVLPKGTQNSSHDALASILLMGALIGKTQITSEDQLPEDYAATGLKAKVKHRKISMPFHVDPPKLPNLQDIKIGKKHLIGCLGAVSLVTICLACSIGLYARGGEEIQKEANLPTPTTIPSSDRFNLTTSKDAEAVEKEYQEGKSVYTLDPFDINSFAVQRQTAYFDWKWWYITDPINRNRMDKVFEGLLSQGEIDVIKADPENFFAVLQTKRTTAEVNKDKIKEKQLREIIDFYTKRKTFKGSSSDFLNQIRNPKGTPTPQNKLDAALKALREFEAQSSLLKSGVYEGRRGSFANTGLPKSEILRRNNNPISS